jgi:hypothetical protein
VTLARDSTIIAPHLPTVFTRLRSLKKLQLYILLPCMAKTVEIVRNNKIELPHINTLFMTGFCAEFLNLFPEVTTLATWLWPPPTKNKTFIHLADGDLDTTKITRLILEKQQNYGRQADGMYKYEKLHEQLRGMSFFSLSYKTSFNVLIFLKMHHKQCQIWSISS